MSQSLFVVVKPNPPQFKGMDEYLTVGRGWVSQVCNATVFSDRAVAEHHASFLTDSNAEVREYRLHHPSGDREREGDVRWRQSDLEDAWRRNGQSFHPTPTEADAIRRQQEQLAEQFLKQARKLKVGQLDSVLIPRGFWVAVILELELAASDFLLEELQKAGLYDPSKSSWRRCGEPGSPQTESRVQEACRAAEALEPVRP